MGGVLGRKSVGIEINPFGWLYGFVKLRPASKQDVEQRLLEIYRKRNYFKRSVIKMPEFYCLCYCDEVLAFLLAARSHLNWRNSNIDATLMSILLVYLHGKLGEGLSNQMRMTKSMGMNYSVQWWKKNGMVTPPQINPFEFILKKIAWRYQKGVPAINESEVFLGDSSLLLGELPEIIKNKFSLLFTSPPYYSITDYHIDQWLRLWLLGYEQNPTHSKEKYKGRFINKNEYVELLDTVFGHCANVMETKSTIYVRTDKREFTFKTTLGVLKKHFSNHSIQVLEKPLTKETKTQTKLYGDKSLKPGEVDIVLSRN